MDPSRFRALGLGLWAYIDPDGKGWIYYHDCTDPARKRGRMRYNGIQVYDKLKCRSCGALATLGQWFVACAFFVAQVANHED